MEKEYQKTPYTCNEYREEMILNSLQKRLLQGSLPQEEREKLKKEIETLEKKMGL